ncbi:MAG: hypothetical protein WDA68_12370 [Phycisphaerae bacterium]
MKKMMILMLLSMAGMCLQAQTVNIHKKDGSVIKVELKDFDYINISGNNSQAVSTPKRQTQSAVSTKNATGTYKTSFAEMTLRQSGNRVTGTYKYRNGRIEGTLNGRTLTGRWTQSNSKGRFVFNFNSDFSGFTGYWSYNDAQPNSSNKWDGTRTGG